MNIAIESQRLFRETKHGMEVVAEEVIRELQKIDTENRYTILVKNDDFGTLEETTNFKIDVLPSLPYPLWEQILLPQRLKRYNPDLVHCTANTAPLFLNTPMVVTIHDLMYLENVSFKGTAYQNFGNLYRRFIVPKIARKSKAIITVSEFEKNNIIERLKVHPEKVHVVYNGLNASFNTNYTTTQLDVIRHKYKLPNQFFLHIGNPAPRKNTFGVLEAYSIFVENNNSDLSLVISGCKPDFINGLIESMNKSKLKQRIICTGYLPKEELPLLYNMALVFLYPSYREGFGMPIVEAMACGTPVITGNNSSLIEVANGAALLVDASKPLEIASAMELALNTGNAEALKAKGIENAKRFSWKKAAEKTIEIYNSVNRK